MKKDEYLKNVKQAEEAGFLSGTDTVAHEPPVAQPEAVETPVEPEKIVEPVKAADPEKPEAVAQPEPEKTENRTETEPVKGWNLLPEETRKELQARLDQANATAEQLKRREHEFNLSQQRLAPTQQQLAKLQADYAKLQNQLKAHESKQNENISDGLKKKLDALRQQFPDEADVIEQMTQSARQEAEKAKEEASQARKQIEDLGRRQHVSEQLQILSAQHPDWREARSSDAFKAWHGALDPYKRNFIDPLLSSINAADAAYVLNEFKHDLAWAQALNGQHAAQPPAAASTATAAPAPDPAPKRRSTAPSQTAGQPISEKKRAFLQAIEALKDNPLV